MASKRQRRPKPGLLTPAQRYPSTFKRAAISAFLLFHICAISVWCLPFRLPASTAFKGLIRPYMLWSGLFQNWNMFAPDPLMLNGFVEAEIVFRDGKTGRWSFPRTEQLGLADRYFKERYRKFANEYLRMDANSGLWPDAAVYIARRNYQPSNPPVIVLLYRYWSLIRPPLPDGSYQADPWMRSRFFLYVVKPGDLP
jgi:hypothetical protein